MPSPLPFPPPVLEVVAPLSISLLPYGVDASVVTLNGKPVGVIPVAE